jgi:hypothetical protein
MVGRNDIVFSGYKSHERQRTGMDRAEQKKNWGKLGEIGPENQRQKKSRSGGRGEKSRTDER